MYDILLKGVIRMSSDIAQAYRSRLRLGGLGYICSLSNLPSIMEFGLLSHNQVLLKKIPHEDISMAAVQSRRDQIVVAGERRLHDYVNLYFDVRNP